MILSCNKILKAATVKVDNDNKVVIDVSAQLQYTPTDNDNLTDNNDESVVESNKIAQVNQTVAKKIRQAELQAEEIIANAKKIASEEQESIRATAETEAVRLMEEYRDIGYKEGMDLAISEGNTIKEEANEILKAAESEKKQMQENLEPEMVDLIIKITEKLLGNATNINPKVIINLIKQGLSSTVITGDVMIYVSADDLEQVQKHKEELMTLTDGSVNLEIVKDLSLNPMDCIIGTPFGDIDCSLGQQFESLRANLTYILNNK